ncbi:helix-turn-helix domain-containing protein [Pedobacter sp. MW01-1-1]|uniref:helix-turn-helix domain-containing protein n=1 Tax=Pedobacter sp. MW01-1-1 TaxID=3383027 RepID=UPI003FF0EFA2
MGVKCIGENIKKTRLALGLSQGAAAKLLAISTPAFCKIETGLTDLNISRLLQIAKTFNVSVSTLISARNEGEGQSTEVLLLQQELIKKEEEIQKLRKKVIDLYDKLGL